jgi:hypothetical protein
MRTFQIVLFVLAMVVSTTQTFRHIYVRWIEPTESVLDQFKTGVDSEIANAETLDELVPLYAQADAKVREYEDDSANTYVEAYERQNVEPYASKRKLEREISDRENRNRQLVQLRFYWIGGLASILIGVWVYGRVNRWLGMTSVIVGFSEMLFWTSPLVHGYWQGQEFLTLLNHKLALSAITWVLLIGLWLLVAKGRVLPASVSDG